MQIDTMEIRRCDMFEKTMRDIIKDNCKIEGMSYKANYWSGDDVKLTLHFDHLDKVDMDFIDMYGKKKGRDY